MIEKAVERDISPSEREFMLEFLERSPTRARRWMQGLANSLVVWAACCGVLLFVWSIIRWLLRPFVHRDLGWHSDTMLVILPGIVLFAIVVSIVSAVSWVRSWRDIRPLVRADLQAGRVVEEHYVFTEALRFQEQEHGGLIYFLRIAGDRALTLYDHESQDLGVQGRDPLSSSFRPTTQLVMMRAPNTRQVLDKRFSGIPLDCGDPLVLELDPKLWPESEELCEIPWRELRIRLSPN